MRVPGWRALGAFWAMVALAAGGTALRLNELGPLEPRGTAGRAEEARAADTGAAQTGPAAGGTAPAPRAVAPRTAADVGHAVAAPPGGSAAAAPTAPPSSPTTAPPSSSPTVAAVPAAAAPAMAAPAAPATATPSVPPPTTQVAAAPAAPEPPPLAQQRPFGARPWPPGGGAWQDAAASANQAAARPIPPPDPALLEQGRHGMLPRLGPEGRTSIRAYGREFDRRDTRPRIGIVVADIGLMANQTEEAIRRLPPAVALALSPYAAGLGQAAERARERGMETLVSIPMEPAGYPSLNDPGDRALLTGRPMAENLDLLDWVLSRSQGYVGAIGAIGGMRGERFAALPEAIGPVQDVLFRRGLLYLDPRPGAQAPARAWGRGVDVILDEPAGTRSEIDRRLAELEQIARDRGAALGLAGAATPVLVERLAAWAATLDQRGLVLAPVSAMIRRPESAATDAAAQRSATP